MSREQIRDTNSFCGNFESSVVLLAIGQNRVQTTRPSNPKWKTWVFLRKIDFLDLWVSELHFSSCFRVFDVSSLIAMSREQIRDTNFAFWGFGSVVVLPHRQQRGVQQLGSESENSQKIENFWKIFIFVNFDVLEAPVCSFCELSICLALLQCHETKSGIQVWEVTVFENSVLVSF